MRPEPSEISRSVSVRAGQLTTAVQLGVRTGSTETAGVELGGSINWLHPETGFSSVANARLLLAGGDQKEWGMSGRLRYAPATDGAGLTMALEPSIGTTGRRLNDLGALVDADLVLNSDGPSAAPAVRLQGELGYGFPAWSGLITPYSDFSMAESGGGTIGMGLRYPRLPSGLAIDLRAAQAASTTDTTDHSIGLVGRIAL